MQFIIRFLIPALVSAAVGAEAVSDITSYTP